MRLNTPTLVSDALAKGLLVDIKEDAADQIMEELVTQFKDRCRPVITEALTKITEDRVSVAMDMYSGGEYKVHVEFKDASINR